MDPLAFISSLVSSLAWPVVVLAVAWRLHKSVENLIPLLTTVKYRDLELDFNRRLNEADAESSRLPLVQKRLIVGVHTAAGALQSSGISPRATIETAWADLQKSVKAFAEKQRISPGFLQPNDTAANVSALQQAGAITDEQAALYASLSSLRNTAAHITAFAPTADDAARFAAIAGRLRESLEQP